MSTVPNTERGLRKGLSPAVSWSALGGIRTPGRLIRSQVLYPD
jgi:hypothetical protein